MKKIYTLTFHSPYNYGSALQAYALQEFIKKMDSGLDYIIINLRTEKQKNEYKNIYNKPGLKNKIKGFLLHNRKKELIRKDYNFEKFINGYLNLTPEINNIKNFKVVDENNTYYIVGSDQMWNINAFDFDWAYFLGFTNSKNKISYAASFGPKVLNLNFEDKNKISNELKKFKKLSVREEGSYNNIKELISKEADINVDPTLLLDKEDWIKLIETDKQLIDGNYIFLYDLYRNKETLRLAKKISKLTKLPIVVSRYNGIKDHFMYKSIKCYDCGPKEFLNLINNAKLVITSSFHGTVFSIIFNKPFFAVNGMKDRRISTLLSKMSLENQSISDDDYMLKCKDYSKIDFQYSKEILKEEKEKSYKYLLSALDLKGEK